MFFCWIVNGILFHINGPLHKKLLEDFTVREVKGRMCVAYVSCHYQYIPSVKSKQCVVRSFPWIILAHVEKGH
jgi:hypothetical protein